MHGVGGEGDRTPQQRISPPATALPVDTMEQLGNEEIISILDSTVARNEILEGEVKTLVIRVCIIFSFVFVSEVHDSLFFRFHSSRKRVHLHHRRPIS